MSADKELTFARAHSNARKMLYATEEMKSSIRLMKVFGFETMPEADARRTAAILRQIAGEIDEILAEVAHDRAA